MRGADEMGNGGSDGFRLRGTDGALKEFLLLSIGHNAYVVWNEIRRLVKNTGAIKGSTISWQENMGSEPHI